MLSRCFIAIMFSEFINYFAVVVRLVFGWIALCFKKTNEEKLSNVE